MRHFKDRRLLVYTVATIYILVAFAWWSVLLLRKNDIASTAKIDLLRYEMKAAGTYVSEENFKHTKEYEAVFLKQQSQARMIWGEGSVLFLGLLWGLWAVNRSFQKEVNLANQQRNFLLSITHELKSPIASIQLVLDTLRKRKLSTEQTDILLNSADNETTRLNELVSNLLLSAKLETSYQPQFEEINIIGLIDDIVAKFRLKFPKATIQFTPKEVPILRGDKQGLVSVFTNLIENAIKYGQNHPVITIKNDYHDAHFTFEIADNGIGIATADKKKIFEKFYRVGNEETRKTKGTGLGLYIVSQVLKAHKGMININDNLPQGTIFKITLPS